MFTLDSVDTTDTARHFIREMQIALLPRFIAEAALGNKLEPNEAEKEAADAACNRFKQSML